MSCTAEYNFCIVAGDDLDLAVRYKADGVPVDVTGYTARMQIRTRVSKPDIFISAVCVVTDALNGEITCSLTAAETSTFIVLPKTKARYVYDLEFINLSGDTITILKGNIDVTIGVTR